MSDPELRPCPFCGVEAKKMLHLEDMWKFLHADSCYFHQTDRFNRPHVVDAETVDVWNSRVTPELICDRCHIESKSVEQMRQSPQNAVYIWHDTQIHEAIRLSQGADRNDLEIYGVDCLDDARLEVFRGQRLSGVVVDHAAKLTDEQKRNHDWLLCRIAPKEVSP